MTSHNCPICSEPAERRQELITLDGHWNCPRCGEFEFVSVEHAMWKIYRGSAYKISAAIRAQNRSKIPQITFQFVEKAVSEPDKTLSEKSRLVLEHIEKRTSEFGQSVQVKFGTDYPLVHVKSEAEFASLLEMHREAGHVSDFRINTDNSSTQIILKAKGFEALEAMRRTRPDADSAFVAMWFHEVMAPIYLQQISPAIQDAGYRPVKIDLVPHNDDVIARIMTEIRLAKFVIADFTEHRNGVYFEAGFAKGIGMEVVWLCREDHMKDAHFDTNHFNHLTWKDDGSLREHLAARILATVGPGPYYGKRSTTN